MLYIFRGQVTYAYYLVYLDPYKPVARNFIILWTALPLNFYNDHIVLTSSGKQLYIENHPHQLAYFAPKRHIKGLC